MRDTDVKRLKTRYPTPVPPGPEEYRLGPTLDLNLEPVTRLGNAIATELDSKSFGIGWWTAYPNMDRKTRILVSDHLLACARAIPQNLLEAEVSKLELAHAVEDFRKWMERGIGTKTTQVPAPHGPYEDLSAHRVSAHLAGVFRAFGSTLDCLAACIVGVAALPTDIVHVDPKKANDTLAKLGKREGRLHTLHQSLTEVKSAAGPDGWSQWLIAMRNMLVHRGRRALAWNIVTGSNRSIRDFVFHFPRSPELTEVEAWVHAGGYLAAQIEMSHEQFLKALTSSMYTYVNGAAALLHDLWVERRANPTLLEQPALQWKQTNKTLPPPRFQGFPSSTTEEVAVTAIGLSNEASLRLKSAGLTRSTPTDVGPSPSVWFEETPDHRLTD